MKVSCVKILAVFCLKGFIAKLVCAQEGCVSDCSGLPDGHYQSCRSCSEIVYCSSQTLTLTGCAGDLVYDANAMSCQYESSTCNDTLLANWAASNSSSLEPCLISTSTPSLLTTNKVYSGHYVKEKYDSSPCLQNISPYNITTARSKIHCASRCSLETQCRYVLVEGHTCSMYDVETPPCSVDILRFDGEK